MFEKVNPKHPDKVADRIAGAIVDLAYSKEEDPKVAVEVLIGHNTCTIINETSVSLDLDDIKKIVYRIIENSEVTINYLEVPQDKHLSDNQSKGFKCGDNGIFKGVPVTQEQVKLTEIAKNLYETYNSDGKYILNTYNNELIICQSNAKTSEIKKKYPDAIVNPLGDWTGGVNVDAGATNRKLGSDMGDSVTGGGLHGKDLSKADVSVNIYAWIKAQKIKEEVKLFCAIGDDTVDGRPYSEIVKIAREYIKSVGGFEKFAEYGLIRG